VVEAQLLKSTISLADYDSSPEEMILDVVKKRAKLEKQLKNIGAAIVPKAIYVVETSNTVKGQEPRPVAIWRTLVKQGKVAAEEIAICTNTKEIPKEAVRVATIDQLSDAYPHIIFNKKLQEGWDDPSVYLCYFDGETGSGTRIQQVLGRAVRQPGVKHFSDDDLNTAYFFVNCPNELLEKITDQLKEELRIYKGDDPDFEPFEFKEERKALPRIPVKEAWTGKLKVPRLQLEMPPGETLKKLIGKKTFDFGEEDRAAKGKALINIVSVKTGDVSQAKRDLLEDMRVRCGGFLYEQIRILSKNCCSAIHPDVFSSPALDKTACYNSKALEHYREVARQVVQEFENHVRLTVLADAENEDYVVGPYQPSSGVEKAFKYAAHPHYDTKAFREDELDVAKALDKYKDYVWVRNKDRLDYGIPLPIKSGSSSVFYPDFLWWVKNTVWAIDPTGKFILLEKVRTKLMSVPAPLKIALITRGKLTPNYTLMADDGWSLLRFRTGNAAPETFDSIDEVVGTLVQES
jgi:type III restriction enzyme